MRNMPTRKAIVKANARLIHILEMDDDEAARTCWACGVRCSTERAHIKASSHGGTNAPSNFFLLCAVCHSEQPDGASYDAQIRWLRTRPSEVERLSALAIQIANVISVSCGDAIPDNVDAIWHGVAADLRLQETRAASARRTNHVATLAWEAAEMVIQNVRRGQVAAHKPRNGGVL